MLKWIKFAAALALLPLCAASSRTLYRLLLSVPSDSSVWALPAGFAAAALLFFLMPRPYRTYVLAHEMTHALWGTLMGARVGRMKVGKGGGHVMLSKNNFIISLAPYFFPFYTGLAVLAWYAAGFFIDPEPYRTWWLVLIGFTWGFHVTFTVYMLSQRQPDIQAHGRIFSYAVIYLANLFFAALWMIFFSSVTLSEAVRLFLSETGPVYRSVQTAVTEGVEKIMNVFGGE